MRKQRRPWQEASLSFLDVISCGFGAIVLLLIVVRISEPTTIEEATKPQDEIKTLQTQLFKMRSDMASLQDEFKTRKQRLRQLKKQIINLEGQTNRLREKSKQSLNSPERQQLQLALQVLTEEMQRLQRPEFNSKNQLIGGIPADSEYIIFVIDSSGSMQVGAWEKVKLEMLTILDIYPQVKGLQILNDMGNYMFPGHKGKWIPDSNTIRNNIITQLESWAPFSNSSPVEGISTAIKTFYRPDRKISIYTLGDDFQGHSIRSVIKIVEELNRANRGSERLVRIHGIGFPVHFSRGGVPSNAAIKFAALMRELSYNNGGTFIGLNSL
jgi:hypothetical protein